jgi:hypothetical protein
MAEQQQKLPESRSTRSYEDWKLSLIKIIAKYRGVKESSIKMDDERVRSYYDQALMPSVCYNELFNK